MAFNKYRFSLKSEELQGATQPNILYIGLASDADAAIFAANLEAVFAADCVTTDVEETTDYTLPYPAGSNREFRMVMRDGNANVQTERLYDVASGTTGATLASDLITAGILLVPSLAAVVSINMAEFNPTQSF